MNTNITIIMDSFAAEELSIAQVERRIKRFFRGIGLHGDFTIHVSGIRCGGLHVYRLGTIYRLNQIQIRLFGRVYDVILEETKGHLPGREHREAIFLLIRNGLFVLNQQYKFHVLRARKKSTKTRVSPIQKECCLESPKRLALKGEIARLTEKVLRLHDQIKEYEDKLDVANLLLAKRRSELETTE